MNLTVLTYLVYLALAVPLTVWVARALHRYGEIFLTDVYAGDASLAHAVNHLLVIGFYLINLGYVALFMKAHSSITNVRQVFENLSVKIGAVAIILGVIHLLNLWVFNAFRRRAVLRARALPPIQPSSYTSMGPTSYQPAGAGVSAFAPPPGTAVHWPAPGTPAP
jgi:uncharacterized membrane protein